MAETSLPQRGPNEDAVASATALPYERQPGETTKQWLAFVTYRDLGPARTLAEVCRRLYPGQRRNGRPIGRVVAWSSKNHWVERAGAWDAEQDCINREAQYKARHDMTQRHLQQLLALQSKAVQRLLAMRPEELRPSEVLEVLDRAMKLERIIRGEPTEIHETRVSGHVRTDLWTRVDQYLAVLRARNGDGGVPPGAVPGECGGQRVVAPEANRHASEVPPLDG
jgi:hypothetical protein